MVFKVAVIIGIAQEKVCERKSAEARLTGCTKIEGSGCHIRLRIVVISGLKLQTHVIAMVTVKQRQTRSEIVLGIAISNVALSLCAHNVVGEVRYAGGRWSAHEGRHNLVVACWPPNRR